MKKLFTILSLGALAMGTLPVQAQFGPSGGGSTSPQFAGPMQKIFGDNQAFSAKMQFETVDSSGKTITVPGKFCMDTGKTRFEVNMADVKGGRMPANAGAQLKAMGMDSMITIGRPDTSMTYLIYPGTQSYLAKATDKNTTTPNDYKSTVTKLGEETIDGHPCIKNKVVVTDKDGTPHESTVWNATDLKQFPIKIVTSEDGNSTTMSFTGITLDKPAASNFEAPSGYTKYDSIQAMMQQMMMKRMGGMGGPPQAPQ